MEEWTVFANEIQFEDIIEMGTKMKNFSKAVTMHRSFISIFGDVNNKFGDISFWQWEHLIEDDFDFRDRRIRHKQKNSLLSTE